MIRLLCASLLFAATSIHAGIVIREVTYPAGSVTARGFLAAPEGDGNHPGVLVVHEWWGLNHYARQRAEKLAALGYVALAVDMYGDGKVANHPNDAGAFAGAVMRDLPEARKRFLAALDFLAKQPEVDYTKLAAIGYCFGGGIVLQMAREGAPELRAVASFHGSLDLQYRKSDQPFAKILVCHGEADTFVTPETIQSFKLQMNTNGNLTFISYPGALHGFTNPDATTKAREFGLNIGYDAKADAQSWTELKSFLKKSLQ